MSNASGIPISAELKSAFDSAKRLNSTAFIKVEIVNEKLEPTHQEKKGSGGWGSDYDQIQRHLEKDKPCFIIFFKGRDELMLLLYVPEDATVKQKMSYSASKGGLNNLLNARSFGSSSTGGSFGSAKQVQQIFGTTKEEFTRTAYHASMNVKGPMSEVEEALQALPKTLDKKEFGKSMGYSLLATVSGKELPPQLRNYAAGNAPSVSTSLFRGGQFNIHSKPSEAKAANKFNVNKPSAPGQVLPGFGSAAAKVNPNATSSSSSFSSSKTSSSNSSSNVSVSSGIAAFGGSGATSANGHGRRLSVSNGKCLVAGCENKRVKNGYCASCLETSAARREAIFAGSED